jgi:selenocysteine lyase/cysteine desulfurase
MSTSDLIMQLEWLRKDIIGRNKSFETPFGQRPLVYADYTASGRGIKSIENYIQHILQYYANTHTEDDFTGKTMTQLLHQAEKIIKNEVNAGPKGKIIFTESGTTGGIAKLQQILGVYWPPATRERVYGFLNSCLERNPDRDECNLALRNYMNEHKPIVFVGPYEHHSNELMWRQTLCDIIEIPLAANSGLDLHALESIVSAHKHAHRLKIGSFSAASNVSGILTDVYEVARILHRNGALACFDFAACAPYLKIDMNKDAEAYFDAIFLSPHKFLGGPGTTGILIFNQDIYPGKLAPTISAGGTVDYVSPEKQEYIKDIESREKPGTPGILQAIRVALVFQLKRKVGLDNIDQIERYYYERFMDRVQTNKNIVFYGPTEADRKIPIIPFNVIHKDKYLHPKFVTKLLNDLFGIQSRAGCSCAGPYGHYLMKIEQKFSDYYRCIITNIGYTGIKPGWVRVNLHYGMEEAEIDYLINAISFVSESGYKFLPLYDFDIKTGEWQYRGFIDKAPIALDINDAFATAVYQNTQPVNYSELFDQAMAEANNLAGSLTGDYSTLSFEPELMNLMYFYACNVKNYHPISAK